MLVDEFKEFLSNFSLDIFAVWGVVPDYVSFAIFSPTLVFGWRNELQTYLVSTFSQSIFLISFRLVENLFRR